MPRTWDCQEALRLFAFDRAGPVSRGRILKGASLELEWSVKVRSLRSCWKKVSASHAVSRWSVVGSLWDAGLKFVLTWQQAVGGKWKSGGSMQHKLGLGGCLSLPATYHIPPTACRLETR